jgi:[ribosomal protein S18]-alanine N-acetyltransferase
MSIAIAPATPDDAQALAALHAGALPPGWPATDFADYATASNRILLKAQEAGALLGLAIVQIAADEAEILSIAVAKEARRRGLGSAMMAACIESCETRSVSTIFLEVAEGNGAALALYARMGFSILSRRADYYQGGRSAPETALVMRLETKWAKSPLDKK